MLIKATAFMTSNKETGFSLVPEAYEGRGLFYF